MRWLLPLLSTLVLVTTCYGWATVRDLDAGLNTNDVISKNPRTRDGATDILLVGNDSRTDAQGNPLPDDVLRTLRAGDDGGSENTDTMILVRVPSDGQRASAVSLPRDTLIRLDDGTHKLNSALSIGAEQERERLLNQGVTDPKQRELQAHAAGQRLLIKSVEDLTGAHIDHYAEVNLLGFARITDAVGGVDVCLKNAVDDRAYSGAAFRAGPQNVRGADALAFVRQRHGLPRGDLDRVVRQQVFLSGLAQRLLSTGTLADPAKLTRLVTAVQQAVVLDTGWDVLGFAQQMQGVTGGNIDFHTMPVDLRGPSGREDVVADIGKVHQFVADLLLDPVQRQAKQRQETERQAHRARTTVNVYNASGVTGLARSVLTTVGDRGYTQGSSGNADPQQHSSLHYAPGDEQAAKEVSDTLGGVPIQANPALRPGTVEVYLGKDYTGPGTQNRTAATPIAWHAPAVQPAPRAPEQSITAGGLACVN